MHKTLPAALVLLALTGPALAETVTVSTTLGERGFSSGFLLSGRQASNIYLPLPAGTDISNVRIGMSARAVVPNLERGSVVISANGQPVDALRIGENARARLLTLDTILNDGEPLRAPALDLRFRADLIAPADHCADEHDPADSLQVLPQTTISYDIELDDVATIADALALLPGQPIVQLSTPLTAQASALALQLSSALTTRGYRPRLAEQADEDAPVSLRLVAASEDGAIRLIHAANRLHIDVPENADVAAFARLWQAAPSALAGESLRAADASVISSVPADAFWNFPSLPGAVRVVQTGELGLDFPMLGADGQRASQARLNLTVAPDWSGAKPVVTIYLNGQLITAGRAEIGKNAMVANLPGDLLRLSNRLTVTVDRAQAEGYCPGANPGHAVQLLPGTGIDYDGGAGGGFAAVAASLRWGGTLALPEAANGEDGLAYLTLASRVLTGLGVGAAPLAVTFGDVAADAKGPILAMGPADAQGLVLPIGGNRTQPDLALLTDQPLASLVVDATAQRLDIHVLDGQSLPLPDGIYLGNSSKALVGPEGVIWQDASTISKATLSERARDTSTDLLDFLRTQGLFYSLAALGLIVFVVLLRTLLKGYFHQRKATK